jgi:hypothetical protein
MMGRRSGDQASLFYEFRLDDRVPKSHLLRRMPNLRPSVRSGIYRGSRRRLGYFRAENLAGPA